MILKRILYLLHCITHVILEQFFFYFFARNKIVSRVWNALFHEVHCDKATKKQKKKNKKRSKKQLFEIWDVFNFYFVSARGRFPSEQIEHEGTKVFSHYNDRN